ncbi:DUF1543 domain-containing protein [Flavobacterium sp. ZS1P14]|uniref:DUF1543 domain-containing protein n=1 Tax=Flavobacterium sp. ZS1P14 TaxID=3401729 RepID=UPI003AAF71B5
MGKQLKLYMIMLGCKPAGRLTEQHDVFFGIGNSLKNLIPQMKNFWPEAKGQLHIDVWRAVSVVDNYSIEIVPRDVVRNTPSEKLFFINLGGYKENEFEEYHYKMLTVSQSLGLATKNTETTTFYKDWSFNGATSHIDDKYGIDVDDIHMVSDLLDKQFKEQYALKITKSEDDLKEDDLHIGYLKLDEITV